MFGVGLSFSLSDRVLFNLELAKELVKPERNTLQVSMRDIQIHKGQLSENRTESTPILYRCQDLCQGFLFLQHRC